MATETDSSHYDMGGYDAIDVMRACMTKDELIGFLRGNVIKYAVRMGRKHGEPASVDAEKLKDYAARLAEEMASR